ncbi:helix-turn-helix transcriptional regulator [Streptomyces sp. NPDC127068]|uniref:helix-turn-helix transcriptional regulator n=1 Tax=Streptomyces sp. NPDC127068 TaxID=3347127 RepID=UPI0036619FF4
MPSDETFGQLLRRLRAEAARTQDQQAEAVNAVSGRATLTRREINRYEHDQNIPTDYTVARIAVACGVPPEQLQRAAASARALRRQRACWEEGEEDEMKRRTALMGGAVVGAAAAAEPWGRLAHALRRGSKIDTEAMQALTHRAGALHISELTLTAQQLRRHVEQHLDALTCVLGRAGEHGATLTIAAGETAALAGWLAWDMGDHQAASAYYQVTTECAEVAGHPPLRALALTYASYGADPAHAMQILDQAASDVRGPGTATAAAWIHGRYAEEAAAIGETKSALRAIDRAQVAYDYGDHTVEQPWVRFMTPARLDSLVLSTYGRLSHPDLSDVAAAATSRLGNDRLDAGVVILGDVAGALLHGGVTDHGVEVARDFATTAAARLNTMGRSRAQLVADQLPDSERDLRRDLQSLAA